MGEKIAVGQSDVLVVVDIQNDFCPGGSSIGAARARSCSDD